MSNDINDAFQSLSDQTKKINIAQHYTHGDMDKARQMVSGAYRDLYVIKVRFSSSTLYGAFIVFFNHIYKHVAGVQIIVSPSYAVLNLDPSSEWQIYDREIKELLDQGDYDQVLVRSFRDKLNTMFSIVELNELSRYLESRNEIAIDNMLRKAIQNSLGLQRVDTNVYYETTSSLEMELKSVSAPKLSQDIIEGRQEKKEPKAPYEQEQKKSSQPKVGVDGVKLILNAALILSPIKGKYIHKLAPGDRIRVSIVDNSQQAIKVAQALDAYEDERFKPVVARIKTVDYVQGAGYKIYGFIAKGIVVDITEEEENIKVALDPSYAAAMEQQSADEQSTSYPLIILLFMIFAAAVGIVLYLVFG